MQDSFQLPDESKSASKNACNEEEKEVDKFMQNALKWAKKFERKEAVSFNDNTLSDEEVEDSWKGSEVPWE
jgi:hypothetical protein